LAAHGYGADANQDASARWASLAAGALGRAPLTSWLALRTRVEATVPLARPRFVVERMGAVHQPAALGMSATFGAEVLFFVRVPLSAATHPLKLVTSEARDHVTERPHGTGPRPSSAGAGAARAVCVPAFDDVYREFFPFVWRGARRLGVGDAALD